MNFGFVIPNSATSVGVGLDNALNAIDANEATFASNRGSGILNNENYALTTRTDQSVLVAVRLHWLKGGSASSSVQLSTGPSSNPRRNLLLLRTSAFSDTTELFYLPPATRVALADNPTLFVEIVGDLAHVTFRVFEIRFLLADRCAFSSAEGAA